MNGIYRYMWQDECNSGDTVTHKDITITVNNVACKQGCGVRVMESELLGILVEMESVKMY
jgi:hypothetical protein